MDQPSSIMHNMTSDLLKVRVARKTQEAIDIFSYELTTTTGRPLPSFTAGAHIDVHIPGGLVRQYSLANDPQIPGPYLIGVLRDSGSRGGSIAMHDAVHEGDILQVGSPRNLFPLVEGSHQAILLAGGIGITPILCMAYQLMHSAVKFRLHYCARSRSHMAFRALIADSKFAKHANFYLDDSRDSSSLDIGQALGDPLEGKHAYVCGPVGLVNSVRETARAKGWVESNIHFELFAAPPTAHGQDQAFEVHLARTGRVILVGAQESVAQALCREGIPLPTSCEQGVCGTCTTTLLAGEPDHRDHFLTPEERSEGQLFVPCSSRARSEHLVLDL